ncbi:MAG TPA: hypothetical protein VGF94_17320 [Kofleriaceae bacterium]|jgi:hypothetical protein
MQNPPKQVTTTATVIESLGSAEARSDAQRRGGMIESLGSAEARSDAQRRGGKVERYQDGWRSGKPVEDPEKLKRWGFIGAKPSEYLVCTRAG